MSITAQDLVILRAISVSGAVTPAELESALPALGDPKKAMERLWSNRYLDIDRNGRTAIYTISAKGRNTLMRKEPAAMGEMPTPRQSPMAGNYTGENCQIRENGEKHKQHGSRRGNEVVPWAGLISMSGAGMEPVGVHGGRW